MKKETRGRKRNRNSVYQPIMTEGIPKMQEWEKEYQEFWKTQLHRCIHGYKPHGHAHIPGRYYFYLNFVKFPTAFGGSSRKVMDFPFYRDIDHEYFQKIEECKEQGKGLIVLKARRKGMSMNNVGGICLYDLTIQKDVNMGVGCYLEDDVLEFRRKFENLYSQLPQYMVQNRVADNKDEISFGRKMPDGIIKGSRNTIYFKHFYNNSGAFRGTSLDFLLFEEAGENLNLLNSFLVSEECFKEGSYQFGTPIIFGTSNQINNGLKDLEELWFNSDKYNLDTYFVSAAKAYYPFFDIRTGKSATQEATDDIMSRRKQKKELQDKRAYFTYLQEMPLKDSDCFIAGASSVFNLELVHDQLEFLMDNKREAGKVMRGGLEWDSNAEGDILTHSVTWVPNKDGKMKMLLPPLDENPYVDVGGVDPYYKDQSATSDSLGSLHIHRGVYSTNEEDELPIFEYVDRPKQGKEEWYENCAKVAVFYNCQLLVEDTDEEFFKWFKHHGFAKYLKRSPVVYKSLYSKAANQYGYNMSGQGRKIKLIDTVNEYINKYSHKIYFKELLKEFTIFGVKNTDRVMSFGLALIHSKDNSFLRLQEIKEENTEAMQFPVFTNKMKKLNRKNIFNIYNKL
jgi:hypothetical protein